MLTFVCHVCIERWTQYQIKKSPCPKLIPPCVEIRVSSPNGSRKSPRGVLGRPGYRTGWVEHVLLISFHQFIWISTHPPSTHLSIHLNGPAAHCIWMKRTDLSLALASPCSLEGEVISPTKSSCIAGKFFVLLLLHTCQKSCYSMQVNKQNIAMCVKCWVIGSGMVRTFGPCIEQSRENRGG